MCKVNNSRNFSMPQSFPVALSQNVEALKRFAALSYEEQRRLLPEDNILIKDALFLIEQSGR